MRAHNEYTQANMTPADALQVLKEGNERFIANLRANRDLLRQVNETRDGQWPFAAVLSCIDSRVSAELVFDQGLGDIFSIRIAGNFVNDDILGSMEFACKVARAKLIFVLGHTGCGAVKGACDGVKLGHLTEMLGKIQPAVAGTAEPSDPASRTSQNAAFVNSVAERNVHLTMAAIRERSEILSDMAGQGLIGIAGGMYDVATGRVAFFED